MPKLTDAQLVILSAAAQREGGEVLPPPKSLKTKDAALTKTLEALRKMDLLEERPAKCHAASWRKAEDGQRMMLVITEAGLSEIDGGPVKSSAKRSAPTKARKAKSRGRTARKTSTTLSKAEASRPASRPGTKQAHLVELLQRENGATINEIAEAIGWQPHSVRGASRLIINDSRLEIEQKPDPALIKVITRAHDWFERISSGKVQSAADIARTEGLTRSYVTRVIRLALLAPDITETILNGGQPPDLSAKRLVRQSKLPFSWDDQRRILGFRQQ